MALVSPGVQVTVTDESFFVPASAPTVPLLFVASGAEKTQPDGVTPAAGTFESDVVRTVTSLNQSVELYGEPSFLTDSNGVALHGDARNEYGLFALNQFLGIGNRAFVIRADVNLDDDLDNIRDIWDSKFVSAGTLLSTLVTDFINEFNESNGLVSTDPLFKTSVTEAEFLSLARTATDDVWEFYSFRNSEDSYFDDQTLPANATSGSQTANFGGSIAFGQQIINFSGDLNAAEQVVDIGNVAGGSPDATLLPGQGGSPTVTGSPGIFPIGSPVLARQQYGFRVTLDDAGATGSPVGTQQLVFTASDITRYSELVTQINNQLSGAVVDVVDGNLRFTRLSNVAATSAIEVLDGVTSVAGSPTPLALFANLPDFVSLGTKDQTAGAKTTGLANDSTNYDFIVSVDHGAAAGSPFSGSPATQTITVQGQNAQTYTTLVTQVNAQLVGAVMSISSDGDIEVVSTTSNVDTSRIDIFVQGSPASDLLVSLSTVIGAGSPASVVLGAPTLDDPTVGLTNPTGLTGATVYTATFTVDGTPRAIQITGATALTFGTLIDQIHIDLNGGVVAGSPPGRSATVTLVSGNLVVTSGTTGTASTIALTDGSGLTALFATLNGFVSFGTASAGTGADSSLLVFANGYDVASTGAYDGVEGIAALWVSNALGTVPGQWTSQEASDTILAASDDYKFTVEFRSETSLGANDAARRTAIVTTLQSAVNSNTEIRSVAFEYNLILCPGYHEVADELVALSVDIESEAFIIADTPLDLDTTATVAWAGTSARQRSPSIAYYYPHSLASNLDGVNVVAAASGTALRTYAFSDNSSELWFAPAGTRRGLVSGVSQVGFVGASTLASPTSSTLTNVFVETNLNNGQRDDLYKYFTNINPIVFFPGRGIVVWGQKTSSSDVSARDRVNVERLIAFIRRSLRKSLLSFVFEPNDALTRDSVKAAVDNFLGDLIVKRGLFDFATVVDESNNTPDRIDRSELWVDVALQPVKAAEFIFIPIRIVATGTEI